jgi:hypothetical protein
MYRKIVVKGEAAPLETIGIRDLAWNNVGGGWSEMRPPFSQMVTAEMKQVFLTPPKASADFTCLGEVAFEGRTLKGYQTLPAKTESGAELARTIYVDPATGLPAFNVIGPTGGGDPLLKEAFTYPADIAIEKPF